MKNKKKAFTLVELLAVVAIAAVLLMIATDRFIGDSFRANATYNQRVDVQTGVKTSMDNVKSILKRSVQVHLVGKEVYKEDMDLSKLDNKYNYIGFRYDEHGNRFLANIVYDKNKDKFNVLPLTAGDKKDIMTGDKISYNLEFYKNDNNYKDKLDKDIITLTITGKSSANVVGQGIQDEYVLKEDIQLPNVNQVLLSRHLQGGVDKITPLAYDTGLIQPGRRTGDVGFVLIMDSSGSMKFNMVDKDNPRHSAYPFLTDKTNGLYQLGYRYGAGYYDSSHVRPEIYTKADLENPRSYAATRKVILGGALENILLAELHKIGKEKNVGVQAYIFDYGNNISDYREGKSHSFDIDNPDKYNIEYFTTLELAKKKGYGPFDIKDDKGYDEAKKTVKEKAGMKLDDSDYKGPNVKSGPATNTGYALLNGLEILKQMKDEGVEKRYLILLTDGEPNLAAAINEKPEEMIASRADYNAQKGTGLTYYSRKNRYGRYDPIVDISKGMDYIKDVTSAAKGNNPKGLYEKAYLIGLSGIASEISRLGIPDKDNPMKQEPVPSNSINSHLRQTGNTVEAYWGQDFETLNTIFAKIVEDIGVSMGVFDGPDKMK